MPTIDRLMRRAPGSGRRGRYREITVFAQRVAVLAAIALALLGGGTLALGLSEGVGAWYAFRWALDTAATVGAFPQPDSVVGQVTHVLLVLVGVGTLFYALAIVAEFFVAGHLGELLAARRTQKMIDALDDHYIICGFGRVGRQVARDLRAAHARFVVVDSNPDNRDRAEATDVHFIEGDAADDDVLRTAGIERARAILACADSDAQNIFITLSARQLREDIAIVARAAVSDSEKKLERAGADRVISPTRPVGRRWPGWRCILRSGGSWTSTPSTGWRRSWSARAATAPARRSATSEAER